MGSPGRQKKARGISKRPWLRDRRQRQASLKAYSQEGERYDLFFARAFINAEGERVDFEDCHKRSSVKKEEGSRFFVRLCPLLDLIKLKKMRGLHQRIRNR